ncbi:hypothetical protein H5410_020562 [Solanum commersonii]|uniref:Peptidase S8/S53 domain-containing protein n=1 Tax=Solanum commersonii TaxID=4109 RepID=A0A9J5Z8S9_SOLCO|nr:hypothetical protein H5410_020562 [Solanum commersonii]
MKTPHDYDGHGSHTLSTAANGGSPKARVAAYKVCWPPVDDARCMDVDILKAFDTAIHDGVDVISISVGGTPCDYLNDGLAIGSFHAVKHGIVVVASAVAASTLDRKLQSSAGLQNRLILTGAGLSKPTIPEKSFYPLISAAQDKLLCITLHQFVCLGKLELENCENKKETFFLKQTKKESKTDKLKRIR